MAVQSGLAGWLHRAADSDVWWSFKSSPLTVSAATVTFLIVAIAFLSPILAPHTPFDPATLSLSDGLKPPAMLSADGDWTFPLGTDDQGRDILSSIMYGTRLSLVVGLASVVFVAMALGITLGLVSGYIGGAVDALIMRIADVQLTFPAILIALLIDGVVRGVISVKRHEEIADLRHRRRSISLVLLGAVRAHGARLGDGREAARSTCKPRASSACRRWLIMFRHVLPNVTGPGAGDRHHQSRPGDHHRGDPVVPRRRPALDASRRWAP